MFVTHALLRIRKGNDVSLNEQNIGAFTGFMVSVFPKEDQSKPYYFITLPKPSTKPVIYTLIENTETPAPAVSKNIFFIQFVGDEPVYAHIVELKYENSDKFAHILPILGSFYIKMSFMSAIYKRLKKSNIEDLLAEASLIAKVQFKFYVAVIMIDQQGYTRFYEAMLRIIISHGRKNYLVPPPHIDDLFKSIGKTGLNSEKRFLAFQSILYDEDFRIC